MIRRIVPPVALVVGSVLLTLLLGEALLRTLGYQPRQIVLNPNFWITGWAEMDPELGWKNRQGSFRSVEPGNALMSFEADGRRSDPIGSKGPDVPKILVVGCSFTQGEGIPDNEPYPHVINRALPDFEVLNFGTGGYGTYQSLLRMRSYFRASHSPTPLVIYGLNGHHATRNVATADWVSLLTTRDGRYLVPPHVRRSGGQFTETPSFPIGLWPLETRSALITLVHLAVMWRMRAATTAEKVAVLHELLRQMNDTARDNKASLLVVGQVDIVASEADWMRQQGIDYVDCQHPDPLHPDLRVGGWGHPNGRMHAYWAKCVLKTLADRGYAVPAAAVAQPVN
jgi:hypothetical protein